jgi:hypothetical protein
MSIFEPCVLRCRCRRDFVAAVACSVNVGRSPHLRAALLAGEFQRVHCPYCRQASVVERDFFYIDFARRFLVVVLARGHAPAVASARAVLAAAARAVPSWLIPAGTCALHVVVGLPALRDLLRAQDSAERHPKAPADRDPAAPERPLHAVPGLIPDAASVLDPRAMLHEVGHAMHARERGRVDAWLAARFGWRAFAAADVDAWVDALGGWGAMTDDERAAAREHLRAVLGPGGRWGPADVPVLPREHAWWRPDCPPRLAVRGAGVDHWYLRFADWHTHAGHAFFLNYQDAEFASVAASTVEVLGRMPDPRAAMSGPEFFAELIAFVHGRPVEARAALPADVVVWLCELAAVDPAVSAE